MSELIRSAVNPGGIATQKAITYARRVLKLLQLIEEYSGETTPRPRLYLRLTEKGRSVGRLLKQIEEITSLVGHEQRDSA
ncbi:MAG: hypothetical protein ACW99U_09625 [Candidatus Thorarchaeota archaeon]